MAKAKIILTHIPESYRDCPFSDFCGWGCHVGEEDECKAFDDYDPTYENEDIPQEFNFSKCPHCVSITDILKK